MAVNAERRDRAIGPVPDGYDGGPDATVAAMAAALARAETARAVVLVEGISDQIALESLAVRLGRDLEAERTVTVPVGGAHAMSRQLARFGPAGADIVVTGVYDVGELDDVRRGVVTIGVGTPRTRADLERLGLFACDADLEEELIRAAGPVIIEDVMRAQGDLAAFRTLQRQPAWRGRPVEAQLHRWLRAGARRNLRYARLLVDALDLARAPRPLAAALEAARPESAAAGGDQGQ